MANKSLESWVIIGLLLLVATPIIKSSFHALTEDYSIWNSIAKAFDKSDAGPHFVKVKAELSKDSSVELNRLFAEVNKNIEFYGIIENQDFRLIGYKNLKDNKITLVNKDIILKGDSTVIHSHPKSRSCSLSPQDKDFFNEEVSCIICGKDKITCWRKS